MAYSAGTSAPGLHRTSHHEATFATPENTSNPLGLFATVEAWDPRRSESRRPRSGSTQYVGGGFGLCLRSATSSHRPTLPGGTGASSVSTRPWNVNGPRPALPQPHRAQPHTARLAALPQRAPARSSLGNRPRSAALTTSPAGRASETVAPRTGDRDQAERALERRAASMARCGRWATPWPLAATQLARPRCAGPLAARWTARRRSAGTSTSGAQLTRPGARHRALRARWRRARARPRRRGRRSRGGDPGARRRLRRPRCARDPRSLGVRAAARASEAMARNPDLTVTEIAGQICSTAVDLVRASEAAAREETGVAAASTEKTLAEALATSSSRPQSTRTRRPNSAILVR
jgi:hypothetical protein